MLPILERELRIRCRQRRTFIRRFLIALTTSLITILALLLTALSAPPASIGASVFSLFSWALVWLCLADGLFSTADLISEEKREGTLGLLFLTPLRPAEIILGKTAGAVINSFYTLLAAVPALSIPLILGGVTAGEFWRAVLTLFLTLSLSLCLGLLVSTWTEETLSAWWGTAGLVFISIALFPSLGALSSILPLPSLLQDWSPLSALSLLRAPVYDLRPHEFWNAVGYTLTVCLAALAGACWLLPRRWSIGKTIPAHPESQLPHREGKGLNRLRDGDPFEWLARRRRGRHRWVLGFSLVLAAGFVSWAAFVRLEHIPASWMGVVLIAYANHLLLAAVQILRSTELGARLKTSGLLDLVTISPVSPQRMIQGLVKGSTRQAWRCTRFLLLGETLAWGIVLTRAASGDELGLGDLIMGTVVTAGLVAPGILDLWAAGWMGLYQGLAQTKQPRAVMISLAWVHGLGILRFLICHPFGAIAWVLTSLGVAIWARDRLLFNFLTLARGEPARTPRFPSPPPLPLDRSPPALPKH